MATFVLLIGLLLYVWFSPGVYDQIKNPQNFQFDVSCL